MNSQEPGQRKGGLLRRWIPRILVMGFLATLALIIVPVIFIARPFPSNVNVTEIEQRTGMKLPEKAKLLRAEKISCLQDKRLWVKVRLSSADVNAFVASLPSEIEISRKKNIASSDWRSWCDPGTPAKYVSFYGCPSKAGGALSGIINMDDPNNVVMCIYFSW